MRVRVRGRVQVHVHAEGDLFLGAASAAACSTLNAGVVERGVVRAEVAATAVP
jgi:hypothetical protein